MAFFEWDVSSITSSKTTLSFGSQGGMYYGILFGQSKGYWVRLPAAAPAIGNILLAAVAGANDGLYMVRGSTIVAGGAAAHIYATGIVNPVTIIAFQKGGRWIKVANYAPHGAGCAVVGGKASAGGSEKKLRLYYKSTAEYTGPTNS